MPIYEYKCLKCGTRFELRRGIGDSDGEIKCPRCGAKDVRRVCSAFAASSSDEVRASRNPFCGV